MSEPGETLVIGLGNPIMGDDGLGLAALARLEREWRLPSTVRLVDGGTWGMRLLPLVERAAAILLLDAIDDGRAPGDLIVLEREELPRLLQHKLSSHQVVMAEVLALAELRGTIPARLAAVGLQPKRIEMSTSLSPEVVAGLDGAVRAAVARLATWGHHVVRAATASPLSAGAVPAAVG
jgi:hydrogenase maturation protease